MQQFNGIIKSEMEGVTSTVPFLSNSITGESKMTEKIISSSPKSIKTCSITECEKKHFGHGYCNNHYLLWRKHGSPFILKKRNGIGNTFEERFWSRVDKISSEKGCWIWNGALRPDGYGQVKMGGIVFTAHRASWIMAFNCNPTKMLLHSCDNKRCINPDHLREGTQQENIQDKVDRNRQHKGETHPNSKLNNEKVREIRRRASGGESASSLARELGLCEATIYGVIKGKSWRHVV